jgi:arylsulfatase
MRVPKLFNLRSDPFEQGDDSVLYDKWTVDHVFIQVPFQAVAAKFLGTFKEFPPRAKSASFSIDQIMEQLMPKDAGGVAPQEEEAAPKKSKAEIAAAHN